MKRFFLTLTLIVFSDFSAITNYPEIIEIINSGEKIENIDMYNKCVEAVNKDDNVDDILLPYIYILLGEYNIQIKECDIAIQCFYAALNFYEDINQRNSLLSSAFPEVMQKYFKNDLIYHKKELDIKETVKQCLKQVYNV